MLDNEEQRRGLQEQRKAARAAKSAIEARKAAINVLLRTSDGKALLYWLLEEGKIGHQPFTNNALYTAFNCGEYNMGLKIQALIIEANPDGYVRMLKEKENDRRAADTINGNASDDTGDDNAGSGSAD